MTEQMWWNARDSRTLLMWLSNPNHQTADMVRNLRVLTCRETRLLACAFCREMWDELSPKMRIELMRQEFKVQLSRSDSQATATSDNIHHLATHPVEVLAAGTEISHVSLHAIRNRIMKMLPGVTGHNTWQCNAIRDVIFSPWMPLITRDDAFNNPTVQQLARVMYSERDFSIAPILADALEDAHCNQSAILEHLRGPGPHFFGCWAIEAVLSSGRPLIYPNRAIMGN